MRAWRRASGLAAVAVCVSGLGATSSESGVPSREGALPSLLSVSSSSQPVIRQIREVEVHVGGARIHALCVGSVPEVFILPDRHDTVESWRPVLQRLDGTVAACAYDRRGAGGSDPAPPRRGWYELLDELRRIHDALGAGRDQVLVGHGLGGLYARLYTLDRPGDVSGLVLVNPDHGERAEQLRHAMPPEAWDAWDRTRGAPNADGVVDKEVERHIDGRRLPAIPVTVLTGTTPLRGPGWDTRFLREAARQAHEEILRGVPLGRHVPVPRDGASLHRDDPRLVADEIVRVVRSAR